MMAAVANPLIEHPWIARTAFVLCIVVGPYIGYLLAGRPRVCRLLAVVAWLPVVAVTLVPVDRELWGRCTTEWMLPTFGRVELLANVVLFIPPVLLAGISTRRPGVALLAAAVGSAAIEALQAALPVLGRSCDTNDWLSNTIGAAIGAGLAVVALRADARRPVG